MNLIQALMMALNLFVTEEPILAEANAARLAAKAKLQGYVDRYNSQGIDMTEEELNDFRNDSAIANARLMGTPVPTPLPTEPPEDPGSET